MLQNLQLFVLHYFLHFKYSLRGDFDKVSPRCSSWPVRAVKAWAADAGGAKQRARTWTRFDTLDGSRRISTDLNQTASRPPGPPVTMDSLRKPHGTGTNQNVKHVNGWDCSIWMHLVSDIASFARKNVGKSWDFSGQVWPEATIRLHKLTLRHPMVSKVRMDFK